MSPYHQGLFYAAGAVLLWGTFPIFYKQLEHLPLVAVIGHRMIWAMVCMLCVVALLRRLDDAKAVIADRRTVFTLLFTSILLGLVWGIFVWAVMAARIVEAAMGYYLMPILSVVAGVVFFRETMRPLQIIAVSLAAVGVIARIIIDGIVPWFGLLLGVMFAVYSAQRKALNTAPFAGSLVETLFLLPIGLVMVLLFPGPGLFERDMLLLVASGAITIIPLVWYICAAQRMPLVTLGTLFYLAPTLGFLSGVLLYDEPFGAGQATMFSLILTGLAVFTFDAFTHERIAPQANPTRYKRL